MESRWFPNERETSIGEQLQNTGPLLTMDQTSLGLGLGLGVGLGLILPTAEPNEPGRLVHGLKWPCIL